VAKKASTSMLGLLIIIIIIFIYIFLFSISAVEINNKDMKTVHCHL